MGVIKQHVNLCDIESLPDHQKFYKKEAGISLICMDESYLTCLPWAQILENAGFYAGPTDDALQEADSNREQVYEESYEVLKS